MNNQTDNLFEPQPVDLTDEMQAKGVVGPGDDRLTQIPGKGIEIVRGVDTLNIPEADLQKVDAIAAEMAAEDAIEGSTAREPMTEEAAALALRLLEEGDHPRPSVRDLAKAWGWHRSKVQRFLSRGTIAAVSPSVSPPIAHSAPIAMMLDEMAAKGGSLAAAIPVVRAIEQAKAPEPQTKPDFDWYADDDASSVLIPEQNPVAAYFNKADDLVLRQQNWPDADSVIIVTKSNIDAFLDALTGICGIPGVGR